MVPTVRNDESVCLAMNLAPDKFRRYPVRFTSHTALDRGFNHVGRSLKKCENPVFYWVFESVSAHEQGRALMSEQKSLRLIERAYRSSRSREC